MAQTQKKRMTDNPLTVAGIVGIGTLAVMAVAVALTGPSTENPVGGTPASAAIEMADAVDGIRMSGGEPAQADADDAVVTDNADSDTGLNLDTSRVVDNDSGEANEPDGGAAPFYPTPSGPEGRDGNAFTTE